MIYVPYVSMTSIFHLLAAKLGNLTDGPSRQRLLLATGCDDDVGTRIHIQQHTYGSACGCAGAQSPSGEIEFERSRIVRGARPACPPSPRSSPRRQVTPPDSPRSSFRKISLCSSQGGGSRPEGWTPASSVPLARFAFVFATFGRSPVRRRCGRVVKAAPCYTHLRGM